MAPFQTTSITPAPASSQQDANPKPQEPSANTQRRRRLYERRRRIPSCDLCRQRKIKCDAKNNAPCSGCISRDVECRFSKRGIPNDVQKMQQEICRLKVENESLRQLLGKQNKMKDPASTSMNASPTLVPTPVDAQTRLHPRTGSDKLHIRFLISSTRHTSDPRKL